MTVRRSVPTEGFFVILGTTYTHIAALLTLLFIVKTPPAYTHEERNTNAQIVYSMLIVYHVMLAAVDYMALWKTRYFQDKIYFFMMFVIILTSYLCGEWVYSRPPGTVQDISEEQKKFELWILVEVILIWAYIFGGAVFMLFNKCTDSG